MGDYRTTAGEALPVPKKERRRRFRRLVFLGAVAAGIVGWAGWAIRVHRYVVAAGYVTTEKYAEVRPPVSGTVAEIRVHTGARVRKGDLLVRLDDSAERATWEEARSQVRKAEAQLASREAAIKETLRDLDKNIQIAKLELEDATTKVARTRELLKKGLVAASALQDALLKEKLAQAQLNSLLNRDRSVYDKELAVLRQELCSRREAAARAEAQVKAREIRAPISGMVLRYEFVIGELVQPNQVLYEIFGGDKLVLKLRVAERYAAKVAVGQDYKASLAPYHHGFRRIWFRGKVRYLRHVIQADGKSTYRVAYCSFSPGKYDVDPGTTAEARIYWGYTPLWFYLLGIE